MARSQWLAMILVLAFTASAGTARAQQKATTKVVSQPSAPLTISAYEARYEPRSSQYSTRGIHHELKYENKGQKEIVALQIGLISFDVWNEFLDRTQGLDRQGLAVGKTGGGTWIANRYADFSFLTGVAYVNRVRFADGEIWTADEREVLAELRKIQKDFDAANLSKPEEQTK